LTPSWKRRSLPALSALITGNGVCITSISAPNIRLLCRGSGLLSCHLNYKVEVIKLNGNKVDLTLNVSIEMYPEIKEHHLSAAVDFDVSKNAYIATFRREAEELQTLIEKKDAEDCLNNIKCVYLGVQLAQFIRNFEERLAFKNKAA